MSSSPLPTLILYGSQTGNAQEIAKQLHSDVTTKFNQLHTRCMSMQDYIEKYKDVTDLPNERLLIIVMSTTGQGDAPDNAQRFLRFFRKQKSSTWLNNTYFAVLGLGDTNYDKFCEPAKRMDKDLAAVGGQRLLEKALADDGVGLELVIEPWRKKFFDAINTFITTANTTSTTTTTATPTTSTSVATQFLDKFHTGTSTEMEKKQETPVAAATTPATTTASVTAPATPSTVPTSATSASTITTPASPAESASVPASTSTPTSTSTSAATSVSTSASASTTTTTPSSSSTSTPVDHTVCSCHPRPSSSIISTSAPLPTLILYGSQTGNAQEIAKTLYSDVNAKFANLHTRCMSMQDYIEKYKDVTDLPNERLLIIVMSTTGQGDAPDNAQRFLRFFRKQKSPTWLSNTHFAVLGLGDTNYDKFCEPAKRMDKDLAAVGGQRLLDKALADDGVGLELVVEPWRKKFFDAINKFIATSAATSASTSTSTSTTTTTTATSSAAQISDKSHTTSTETEKKQDTATTASTSSVPSSSSSSSSSSSTTEIIPSSTSTITAAPATSTPIPATTAATTTSTTTSTTTTTSTSTTPTASSSTVTSTPLAPLSTDHIVKSLSQATLYPRPQPLTAATASTALTVPHEKPKGLPPLRSCHVHLQYHTTDLPYDPATYVMSRFKKWDTDAVLKGYTSEAPLMATLGRASWLTTSSSIDRHVLHLELDLPPHGKDNILYNVGDAVGIYCPNSSQLVDSLIERLGLVGTDIITLAESDDKDRNTLAHISTPCTIRDALLYCCDIQDIPRKALLRVLYEYCHDIHDKQRLAKLMGPMGYVKLMAPAVRPTLLDLLYQYPSCRPPLDHLLDQLPPLKPRFYSVASSPDQYPTSLHVAFTLVEWEARIPDPTSTDWDASHPYTISRKGLCTSWLYEACRVGGLLKGEDVTRAVYRSEEIKQKGDADGHHGVTPAPTSISSTIAGVHRSPTGTGVAPYRGFLQHRQVQRHALESGGTCMGWWRGLEVEIEEKKDKSSSNPAFISRTWTTRPTPTASRGHYDDMDDDIDPDAQAAREKSHVGPMTLFFGCRHRDQDYLYRDEWQQFLTDGTLTELHVAFSREQAHKVYVQELIRQQGAKLAKQIVHEKGHVYVCGDGTRMATDVMAAIESILCHHASMSATDAKAYVQTMMKESRYLQDIWS